MYRLLSKNKISIGKTLITLLPETEIQKIEVFKNVICFYTNPSESGLNWNKIETHQIWEERCKKNPSELFCYNLDGSFRWKFSQQYIVGIGKIIPELKREEEFVTSIHYEKYMDMYKGKELIEVYVGGDPYDKRYLVDANTGDVYGESLSK
jgi:hypothetical protein